ncbi:MAG: ethanolamine ammonia-lyase light chain EutC, partial [Anaerolineaceae bacterium]
PDCRAPGRPALPRPNSTPNKNTAATAARNAENKKSAINNHLAIIYPVIEQGLKSAGISLGTPFFIEFARVGVINDVNEVIGADLVLILIGERPGLGVADAMSAYMGYKPAAGKTDADRDVICMITRNGGTNPLEGGAFVVELIKKTLKYQASGVNLKLKSAGES